MAMTRKTPRDGRALSPSRRGFIEMPRPRRGGRGHGNDSRIRGGWRPPAPTPGRVGQHMLGKTGLKVSEIGFGGHSWAYRRRPRADGSLRKVTVNEAVVMIRAGLELGVNFLDSCTPLEESSTPGEAIKGSGPATA